MYNNEYFVVDMASCSSTGEIINSLSLALETLNHTGKKIILKLNNSYLNQSQLLSIQSLIASYGCILDTVETTNEETSKVAEGMNMFVQQPLEKRIESRYQNEEETSLDALKVTTPNDNSISLKEVNGLHFEADLEAIQEQQNNINISSDLNNAGINPESNFTEIENQLSSKMAEINNIKSTAEQFSKEDYYDSITTQTKEEAVQAVQNALSDELKDAEKNSIGVYKKAYDEGMQQEEQWEDVDFYETSTNEPVISDSKSTTYINQTLRSGQIIESEGNVVIIGDCHPGSEIRAVGDITVWGVLSGIAHAGYKGNINSKVRALKMNAVQLRIANCYSRRPDGTNIPYIIRSSIFTPEEARVTEGEIMLYKINQN